MKRAIASILSAVMAFSVTVSSFAAQYEAPRSSLNVMSDPMRITDEEFFGEWDGSAWVGDGPILRYDDFKGLSGVEELAKSAPDGDYSAAKAELLRYFKEDRTIPKMESQVNLGSGLSGTARAVMNDIISDGGMGNEVEIGDQWAWHKIDVTSNGAYMIMALDKTEYDILIQSKESGPTTMPFLDIQTSKTAYRVYPTGDTYIRAGIFRLNNYGSEEILKVHEEGMPISDFTKRTYIYFDLSQYDLSGVQSATLNIYAKTDKPGTTARISITGDSKFNENELNWNTNTLGKFSYQDPIFGRHDIYDWTEPANAMSEWINGLSRMGDLSVLAAEFDRSGDEKFAELAINRLLSYYHYRQPFAPRILDATWRTKYIMLPLFTLLESKTMTPEIFTAILKLYNYTSIMAIEPKAAANNRGTVLLDAAFVIGSYFPEIVADDYWERANEKAKQVFETVIFPNFGGYAEASVGGYPSMVLDNIINIIKYTTEVKQMPVDQYWYDQADNLATYLSNVSFPDGLCAPYGDNSTSNHKAIAKKVSEYTGNEHLRYFGTGGTAGKQLYPSSALAAKTGVWMMKTDIVNKNALALFGNAENSWGHRHSDDLSIDVYGYGHLLLREPGNREYDSGTEKALFPTYTHNHNTITIDKLDQKQNVGAGINKWASNDITDYVDAYTNGYLNKSSEVKALHTRKILFLKELGFWIVSDIVQDKGSKGTHDYYQTWSPNRDAYATVDETTKTMTTHYTSGGNIQVIPADPEELTWDNGEPFSKTYIEKIESEKLMYVKEDRSGDVTFDTVLYPTKAGTDDDFVVTVDRLPMEDVPTSTATALKINIPDTEQAYYYNAHDKANVERTFGKYSSDADMAFIHEKNAKVSNISGSDISVIRNAETGKDLFVSDDRLSDVSISISGQIVNLNTETDLHYVGVKIYAPQEVKSFTINGVETEYVREGDYIVKPANPTPAGEQFKIGDYFAMGTYNGESIIWRIVDVDENGPLAVADRGLTKREYDAAGSNTEGSHAKGTRAENGSDYWADSNLRDWLNSDEETVTYSCGNAPSYASEAGFMTNFNDKEKSLIKTVNLKNILSNLDADIAEGGSMAYRWVNSTAGALTMGTQAADYENAYYNTTSDKMFIPDIEQIDRMYMNKKWLGDDYYMVRDAYGAINIGLVRTSFATDASGSQIRVTIVNKGENQIRNTKASNKFWVRPAFYIDDANFDIVSGDGTKAKPYSMNELPPKSLQIGDYVSLGTYEGKDIMWRVSAEDENGIMLLTDKILTTREYDAAGSNASGSHGRDNNVAGKTRKDKGSSYWSDSNIRDWLNSADEDVTYTCGNEPSYKDEPGFLNGFTDNEIAAIKTPVMKDILSPLDKSLKDGGSEDHKWATNDVPTALNNYDTAWYEMVSDKVFIPDIKQMALVYANGDILGSDYYIGRLSSNNEQLYTWLRLPMQEEKNGQSLRILRADGTVQSSAANATVVGVRPAIYVDKDSFDLDAHEGSIDDPYIEKPDLPVSTPTPSPTAKPTAAPTAAPTATPDPDVPTPSPAPTEDPSSKTIEVGDYVSLGSDNGSSIVWRVTEIGENGPLLITDKILSTTMKFDEDGSNYWPESDLCIWLNDTFYNSAFTETEKALIASQEHKNIITGGYMDKIAGGTADYPWTSVNISGAFSEDSYNNAYYVTGTEKLFLPDIKQLHDMQVTNKDIFGDNYANAKDAGGNYVFAWTRTPMTNRSNPASTTQVLVTKNVADGLGNGKADAGALGIRPMMYLNASVQINTGSGTADSPYVLK